VVDSNDRDRVVEARDELHRMLNEVCNTHLLLFLLRLYCVLGWPMSGAIRKIHPEIGPWST